MVSKERHALLALFLVLFIDGMGQGLIFPILTNVIINPHSHDVLYGATRESRTIWYGVIICSFFFTWFFGAAILGDISDRAGRKKALLICLLGAAFGYLLSALAFFAHSVWLLVAGRMIYGFTSGSQPIAQACITDVSSAADKAKNMGYILMAVTLGVMAGPILGGFLSDSNLVPWFKNSTPLYFACLLAIFNICYLWFFFNETSKHSAALKFNFFRAVEIFVSAFKDKDVRYVSLCFTVLQLGWSIYYLYITVYLARKFNFNNIEIALFFALLGLGLTLGFAILVKHFQTFAIKKVIAFGYGMVLLTILITITFDAPLYAWLAVVPGTACVATGYAYIITLFSNQAGPEKQGWVMGVSGALLAFAAGVAILISTILGSFNVTWPLSCACVLLGLGMMLILNFKSTKKSS